ncbi:MAG: lipid II flippase MurJ, partial [Thiogranum sp.]
AAAGLIILARPAVSTLFQYGDFQRHDVDMAGLALVAYGLGLPGFMLVKVLAPAFFSRQDTKTPVKIAIRALISNMVMNVVFVVPLVLLEVPGAHAGLALATALASYINAGLLYRQLRRDGVFRPNDGWPRLLLQMMFAIGVMAVVVGWGAPGVDLLTSLSGAQRTLQISLWIVAGVVSYLIALRLAGVRLSLLWAPAAETGRKP